MEEYGRYNLSGIDISVFNSSSDKTEVVSGKDASTVLMTFPGNVDDSSGPLGMSLTGHDSSWLSAWMSST